MLRFSVQCVLGCVTPGGTRLRALGHATGWLVCLCAAATALVASAFPTPTLEEPSPVPASNPADGMLIIGSVAGLGAGWTSTQRPLFATFEQGSVDTASVPPAAGGSNQTRDDGAGTLDLEFVTIAGVAYNTGLGPDDPATCGPVGGPPCVAIYDGLLETALALASEARYSVN